MSVVKTAQPNPTHDKFFGEKNGNWQEGRSSSSGTSGCLIEHSLSRRACSCVIPQRYPTPAEDADGQNMDPPMASPPSEHPLPHDEISSACSGGNVRLGVGKGRRGTRGTLAFVLNLMRLQQQDKPWLFALRPSWTSATAREHPQTSLRPNLDQFEFLLSLENQVLRVGCATKN